MNHKYRDVAETHTLNKTSNTILGVTGVFGKKLVTMRRDSECVMDGSQNIIVSGSEDRLTEFKKTFIQQAVSRKESVIVDAEYMEEVETLLEIARKSNYKTHVLNFIEPKQSDGWNFVKAICGDGAQKIAELLARTILHNVEWEDVSKDGCEALLAALLMRVALDEGDKFPKKNLYEVVRILIADTDDLDTIFAPANLSRKELPCLSPYFRYQSLPEKVKVRIVKRLAAFMTYSKVLDENFIQIPSGNEIDMTLPAKEPCLYIVAYPGYNYLYHSYVAAFMALASSELTDCRTHTTHVNFVLSSLHAYDGIRDWTNIIQNGNLSGVSYVMEMTVVDQLRVIFPTTWKHILSLFPTLLMLGYQYNFVAADTEYNRDTVGAIYEIYQHGYSGTHMEYDELFDPGKNKCRVWFKNHAPLEMKLYHSEVK